MSVNVSKHWARQVTHNKEFSMKRPVCAVGNNEDMQTDRQG